MSTGEIQMYSGSGLVLSTPPKFILPFSASQNLFSIDPLWKPSSLEGNSLSFMHKCVGGPDCCWVHEIPCLWHWWNETPVEHGHWRCAVLIPIFSCKDLSGPALEEIPSAENCWMLEEVFRRTIIYTFLFLFHSYVYLWPLMETGQLARWSLGHCYILRHFYLHWLLPQKDSPDGSGAGDSPYYVMGSLTWQQSLQKNF